MKDETALRFERAYEKWQEYCALPEVGEQSSDQAYINNIPFREIVALGSEAVPMIIRKLEEDQRAHFLIHALSQITGKKFSSEELEQAKTQTGSPLGNQGYARLWTDWWKNQSNR